MPNKNVQDTGFYGSKTGSKKHLSGKILSGSVLMLAFIFAGSLLLNAQAPSYPTSRQMIVSDFEGKDEKVKIAFFDADSTLRVAPSGKPSANMIDDVAILPDLPEKMKKLAQDGYLIAIVSNQAGVQYGYITLEIAEKALVTTVEKLGKDGVIIHYFDFSEQRDENRKPNTGMAKILAKKIMEKLRKEVDWENSIMVGDSGWKKGEDIEPDGKPGEDHSNSDRLFAENLSKEVGFTVKFFHPRDFFGWEKNLGVRNFSNYFELEEFIKKRK